MGLSDCPKCWETPCGCGHEYRMYWSIPRLEEFIETLQKVLEEKKANSTNDERIRPNEEQ